MKESEYNRLRRQIEDEYQQKIDALELVWDMANSQQPKRAKRKAPGKRQSKGIADALVDAALEAFSDEAFIVKDVCEWIEKEEGGEVDRTTLSHKLKARVIRGEIEIVSEGKGRKPTVYRHVPSREILLAQVQTHILMHVGVDPESEAQFLKPYGCESADEIETDKLRELIEEHQIT